MQGRFIATAAATAIAALAIGPAAALAAPGSFVDDAVGDFAAGSAQSASAANPGVVLNRTMTNQPFGAGPSLATGWTADQWTTGSGSAAVSNGTLTADGVNVHGSTMYHPDQVLEFTGTFYGAPSEHVGFGDTLADGPWAIFSTGAGTALGGHLELYARTLAAPGTEDPATVTSVQSQIVGFDASLPHMYRIEWPANQVNFFVDGLAVATHNVTITAAMRPVTSDLTLPISVP